MDRGSIVRGLDTIDEAASLLRRIRFSIDRPARSNDNNETMSVLITCYGLALERVGWEGLRINVERKEEGHDITWLAFLDARGQALRERLPAGGEYSLSLPCRVKSQLIARQISSPRRQIRKRGGIQWSYDVEEAPLRSIRGPETSSRETIIQEGRTDEPSLMWRLAETEHGDVEASFEAAVEMDRRRLIISLIESKSGRVQSSGMLELVRASKLDRCEGRLILGDSSELVKPYDLVLEELPPVDSELT
jgi:hypothetical protein